MPIRLVLVDPSDIMRPAIVRLLQEESRIELVGEATSFAEALKLTAALKPDVVLMDLHTRDESEYLPALIKSQILLHAKCILAISLWNDDDAKALAESFGAKVLLEKTKLYSELIPAIKQFCPDVKVPQTVKLQLKKSKQPSIPSIVSDAA